MFHIVLLEEEKFLGLSLLDGPSPFDKLPSAGSGRTASGLKEGLEYERLGWTTRRCLACRVCFPVLDSMTINGNGVLFLREAVFLVLRMSHVPH